MQLSKEVIEDVAGWLDMGMICYVHKESHKVLYMPDPMDSFETEGFEDVEEEIEKNGENYMEFEKMCSSDSFSVMEDFIDEVENPETKKRLQYALDNRKPFRNFRNVIDQIDNLREQWFKFKTEQYEKWVRFQIEED